MKMSELKFKVITGTPERNRAIQEALFAKGGAWINGIGRKSRELEAQSLAYNARANGYQYPGLSYGSGLRHFAEELDAPEVTFQQALDLIGQVEMPEPEFPFKPKDWCLVTDKGAVFGWKLAIYSHIVANVIHCIGSQYDMIAEYREELIGVGKWPEEWWEIEDGEPKLIRR